MTERVGPFLGLTASFALILSSCAAADDGLLLLDRTEKNGVMVSLLAQIRDGEQQGPRVGERMQLTFRFRNNTGKLIRLCSIRSMLPTTLTAGSYRLQLVYPPLGAPTDSRLGRIAAQYTGLPEDVIEMPNGASIEWTASLDVPVPGKPSLCWAFGNKLAFRRVWKFREQPSGVPVQQKGRTMQPMVSHGYEHHETIQDVWCGELRGTVRLEVTEKMPQSLSNAYEQLRKRLGAAATTDQKGEVIGGIERTCGYFSTRELMRIYDESKDPDIRVPAVEALVRLVHQMVGYEAIPFLLNLVGDETKPAAERKAAMPLVFTILDKEYVSYPGESVIAVYYFTKEEKKKAEALLFQLADSPHEELSRPARELIEKRIHREFDDELPDEE